jgi:protein-tyrosine phosphatase
LQVRALLTAAKGVEIGHPKSEIPYFLYVPAEDHESFDIGRYFHQAAGYIHECIQRTNIMVHCLAGVSRSVSLVLAYLMKHRGMSYR